MRSPGLRRRCSPSQYNSTTLDQFAEKQNDLKPFKEAMADKSRKIKHYSTMAGFAR